MDVTPHPCFNFNLIFNDVQLDRDGGYDFSNP